MIQSLSDKYRKHISWPLFFIFHIQVISPLAVYAEKYPAKASYYHEPVYSKLNESKKYNSDFAPEKKCGFNKSPEKILSSKRESKVLSPAKVNIGGPGSPEASSFKAVGSNNLVNLASGDFSYSIPLLDVGGYPVNLFYTGGITMEQEASWVGLGWNINPGAVSRNMRGVPDDFNGTDLLTQHQNLKPNRTWGGEVGFDLEIIGLKNPKFGGSLGFSYNNYLGPELDIGAKVSISLSTAKTVEAEKKAGAGISASLGTKLSSRSGLTFSPSLSANGQLNNKVAQGGIGLSTSYNSRTGIKALNLSAEASTNIQKGGLGGQITQNGLSSALHMGTAISFAKPSYLPALRMPMENSNYSLQMELGGAIWGLRVGISAMGYYSESKVPDESRIVTKPLVGYMFSEKAYENNNAVMDFNRLADAEVTPNTPIISAPQYNYDVFSIQGEGTGGSIRAYRGDLGYVRDNVTTSKEKNISVGVDLGIPFHLGVNVNVVKTPTRVGGWENSNNTLRNSIPFTTKGINRSSFENVYFKNPGEASVTNPKELERIGNDNLVRFQLGGSKVNPRIESRLEQFNKKTNAVIATTVVVNNNNYRNDNPENREKRTQVITMLNAGDARKIGLDSSLKNYTGSFDANNNIVSLNIPRVGDFRKAHHISEIDVLEQSGMRYVYGLPVYSTKQKDFTFTVKELPANAYENQVAYGSSEPTISSEHMGNKSKYDGYMQSQETPAYAASFLLSGLLSPDYVDVTGNGITEDDLGSAVKFDYSKSDSNHKWRTPRNNGIANSAHFSEGIKTEKKDNKASISYGEREVWYLNAIESKSMVAIFKTDTRNDAKGVLGEMDGRINTAENANKKLTQIDLYTKAEIKAKGYNNAKPIKTVKFEYDYSLCNGTPDNLSGGKLTLKSVYFSYNGQPRNNKDRYVFNYGNLSYKKDNPVYSNNASDRWGTYKPALDSNGISNNPVGLTNAEFPYTLKDKSKDDIYAGAWSLKKILLPSGGQMEIQYEADDYAYVQDRRSCNMLNIAGLGNTTSFSAGNKLYNNILSTQDNNYVYVQLPQALTATNSVQIKREIYAKYLEGISLPGQFKLAFKLLIKMPNGWEPLTIYPEYDDYGICANNSNYIYIHLATVDGKNGLVNSSLGFLTENIPGQAFNYGDDNIEDLRGFIDLAGGMLANLTTAFQNVNQQMRIANKGKYIDLGRSFIRLANPAKNKYGGGYRVKSVRVKNNWNKMTGAYNSVYGQDYDYTRSEKINGIETVISSGVASYEPGIGSEENPFREIVSFKNKMPLASAQYGAIEMPMLEALYPSPNVVYSKVTVRSIHRKGTHGDSTLRSAIGKQVTEFYTAKDYPSYSSFTPMNSWSYKKNPFFSFFYKEVINYRTISQGFLVETNDMHGKMKSQLAYSESDEKTPLSASYHTYKNTGKNNLNDKVDFVYNNEQGAVHQANMGIDVELMTDVREFSVKSNGVNVQMQVDLFVFYAVTIPLPTFFPFKTHTEDIYRAVTCTKLINYHAIEDSVIVMDKGSVISTKTIAYDAETGSPLVTKTANEFNDPVYNVSYPAYWAYSGTGLAYKNINREFTGVNFNDGVITIPGMTSADIANIFESGDELYITKAGGNSTSCIPSSSASIIKIWAYDPAKNNSSLTGIFKNLVFMDKDGYRYTRSNVSCRIVRSGKRNNLGLTVFSATTMANPVYRKKFTTNDTLLLTGNSKVVATSAVEYKEKWQTDGDAFLRKAYYTPACGGPDADSLSCNGILENNLNPYIKGLIGNFKPYRSYTYYGERNEMDPVVATTIRKDGLIKDFTNYWYYDKEIDAVTKYLIPSTTNAKWVWNSELTKVNSKGQELETKDALNRYTAAQYGFAKNMPVSMTQNARAGESFAEGFEDAVYKERINIGSNNIQDSCGGNKYIDFTGLGNGSVVPAESVTLKAHSGKNVLSVNANSQVVKSLKIVNATIDNYNLKTESGIILGAVGPYGTSSKLMSLPASEPVPGILNINYGSTLSMNYQIHNVYHHSHPYLEVNQSGFGNFRAFYKTTQFFKVTNPTTYTFSTSASHNGIGHHLQPNEPPPYFFRTAIILIIRKKSGETVFYQTLYSDQGTGSWSGNRSTSGTAFLPCGEYTAETYPSSDITYQDPPPDPNNPGFFAIYEFNSSANFSCSPALYTYSPACTYNKPIPGNDSMLNPVFNLVAGKKMQFSAWVKEDCTTPCPKTNYSLSKIEIWSGGVNIGASSVTNPVTYSGRIIEGWQKIEGEFTVPSNTSTAELRFINSNTAASMYVDDIRIHPYNANMKSYVYDPRTLRLSAELDENNYASFYEYDEEGQLVRVKKETIQGIKTIQETRSSKQKVITDLQ